MNRFARDESHSGGDFAHGAVLDFRTVYREGIFAVRTVDRLWQRDIPWIEDPVQCSAGGLP